MKDNRYFLQLIRHLLYLIIFVASKASSGLCKLFVVSPTKQLAMYLQIETFYEFKDPFAA